jgi:hypothetical protein
MYFAKYIYDVALSKSFQSNNKIKNFIKNLKKKKKKKKKKKNNLLWSNIEIDDQVFKDISKVLLIFISIHLLIFDICAYILDQWRNNTGILYGNICFYQVNDDLQQK